MSEVCLCGCGSEVGPGRKWRRGHSSSRPKVMTAARQIALRKVCESNRLSIEERFARYATGVTATGCVEWSGNKDSEGYGRIKINQINRAATHIALELSGTPRPSDDLNALHRCDNPACVNSEHLWWGTQAENIQDCWEKGRAFEEGLRLGRKIRFDQLKDRRESASITAQPFADIARSLMLAAIRNEPSPSERRARIMIMRRDGHLSDAEAQDYIVLLGVEAA